MWFRGVWVWVAGAFLHWVLSSHQHLVFRSMPSAGKSLCSPWATRNRARPPFMSHGQFFSGVMILDFPWEN